jgi:hypothetical protein
MAYVGLQPVTQTLSTATQYFNGDGTTLQFTLQQSVGKASDIIVAVGSTLQVPGNDYSASSTSLIFNAGKAPTAGTNNVSVTFISSSLQTLFVTANAYPTGNSVAPAIYSVAATSTGIYWPSTTSLAFSASGNTRVTVSDAGSGVATSTSTGALRIAGGMGITGAVYGNSMVIVGGAPSTGTTSGALQVQGGIGATGAMFLGGTMTIAGGLTVAGAFNTTSTNSLTINTPFVFVANTNVGDAIDQGIVGTYNDGSVQRYTGFYRAQSDGRWKIFANLTNPPSTLVDSANVSYRYADLWIGNANVTATTTSTTATTGALTVWGGVGVRSQIYVNSINNAIAIGNGGSSGVGDIGASGATFGNVWGTAGKFTLPSTFNNSITLNTIAVTAGTAVIINGGTSGVGDIGASGATFGTVYAKATSAQYADLAEKYTADTEYQPGTVLAFGGAHEVTVCDADMSNRIAGVVSTQPAYSMNDGLQSTPNEGKFAVTVALLGRVPCKVRGPISKGDMLVSAGDGYARAENLPQIGTVIGKALEDFTGDHGVIEVVVGRN